MQLHVRFDHSLRQIDHVDQLAGHTVQQPAKTICPYCPKPSSGFKDTHVAGIGEVCSTPRLRKATYVVMLTYSIPTGIDLIRIVVH